MFFCWDLNRQQQSQGAARPVVVVFLQISTKKICTNNPYAACFLFLWGGLSWYWYIFWLPRCVKRPLMRVTAHSCAYEVCYLFGPRSGRAQKEKNVKKKCQKSQNVWQKCQKKKFSEWVCLVPKSLVNYMASFWCYLEPPKSHIMQKKKKKCVKLYKLI